MKIASTPLADGDRQGRVMFLPERDAIGVRNSNNGPGVEGPQRAPDSPLLL